MAQTERLQRNRRETLPLRRAFRRLGEPSGVVEIAPKPRLQTLDALGPQQAPEFQRPEAAAERNAPVAIIGDFAIDVGAQVTGVRAHDPDQMLRIAHVIERAVEGGAEPFVRIEHERIGALDALPHRAHLRQNHRRAGHRRVDMQPEAVGAGDVRDRRDRIDRGGRGRAHRRDDRAGLSARGDIVPDRRFERVRAHGESLVHRDEPQVLAPEAGEERILLDRGMRLRGRIDDERLRNRSEAAAREREIARLLARRR